MTPKEQDIPGQRWAFPVRNANRPFSSYEGANPQSNDDTSPSHELFEGYEFVLITAEGSIGFVDPKTHIEFLT